MSLFTSSSEFSRSAKPLLLFLLVHVLAGAAVMMVPWTDAGTFVNLCLEHAGEESREILLMGDSKVFPFVEGYVDCPFFDEPAYAFAMDSATVLYQRILYNRLIRETSIRPRVVFYSTGANNFNENGLHVLRDYAIRFLAGPEELWEYRDIPGAAPFLLDALLARAYPVYGKRIEITHLMVRGYRLRTIESTPPQRDPVADKNYLLIYKRGVLANYRVSEFHMQNLVRWAREIRQNGGELIVLDLPVTAEMRALELEVCGEWDERIRAFSQSTGTRYLDLRGYSDFPFRDINHLSNAGAKEVVERWLEPLVNEIRLRSGGVR